MRLATNVAGVVFITAACWQFLDKQYLPAALFDGISAKYCRLLHRADGYCYAWQPALPPRPEERGFQRGRL